MKRFQVYKNKANGGLMHITSLLCNSLGEAIKIANDTKINGGGKGFYVTGIVRDTGEDIAGNLPYHIRRRIENNGNKVKFKGSLFKYIKK